MSDRHTFAAGVIPARRAIVTRAAQTALHALVDDLSEPGVYRDVNYAAMSYIVACEIGGDKHTLPVLAEFRETPERGGMHGRQRGGSGQGLHRSENEIFHRGGRMKFIAQSLEDIAGMFDKMAASERKWAEAAKSATARKEAEITAHVWEQAAGIVRDTELREDK